MYLLHLLKKFTFKVWKFKTLVIKFYRNVQLHFISKVNITKAVLLIAKKQSNFFVENLIYLGWNLNLMVSYGSARLPRGMAQSSEAGDT